LLFFVKNEFFQKLTPVLGRNLSFQGLRAEFIGDRDGNPRVKHFPIPEPEDPVQVLEYYMESRGLTAAEEARISALVKKAVS